MRRWIIIAAFIAALLVYMGFQQERISQLESKYESAKENIILLNGDIHRYKIRDSLNVAEVRALHLRIKDYERLRKDDAEIIADLKSRRRELESVIETQTKQMIELSTRPVDTLIIRDSVPILAKKVSVRDKWYDFDGIMSENDFRAELTVRDSLIAVESVEYKRFLGFLWKTSRVRDRQMDVVSRNPYTEIMGLDFVIFEK